MTNYTFTHPDYTKRKAEWRENRDAVEGEDALKARPADYLPHPTPNDLSAESKSRYEGYVKRAVYTNAVGRTVTGMVGIAFGDWPHFELPQALEYMLQDVDGAGVGLVGQAQLSIAEILTTGRIGLLADFPKTEGGASVADMREGRVAARSVLYRTEDIHDWAVTKVGSALLLTFVKLFEKRQQRSEDGFEVIETDTYRVLRLRTDGEKPRYTVEILVKQGEGWVSEGENVVTDSTGAPWDRIPFTFVGATNNDARLDRAPISDMVKVSLGMFRNSADYEESVFMLGQPQVTMTGLDEQWRDHLEQQGVYFGSRRVLMGPVGAQIGLLQVQPNTLAAEAMKTKREELVSLGARLLQPGSAVKTEHQSKAETRASYSVLSLICDNVSEAYRLVLTWAARFMGTTGKTDFAIDTEFEGLTFNTEIVKTVIAGVQAGLIPRSDAWTTLRRLNLVDQEKTDEEIKDEIESDGPSVGGFLDPSTRTEPGAEDEVGGPRKPAPGSDPTE